jgi:hypothetical protein
MRSSWRAFPICGRVSLTPIESVMRLHDAKIKQAILHPESEVRLTAVDYFAGSQSCDPEVMPLVIQAVEKYGRNSSFRLLRYAEHLVQTAATLDWLIGELGRDLDIDDINADNLRFALGLVVLATPVDLLRKRKPEIDLLAAFAAELRGPLDERLDMANWRLEKCWEALEELGRTTMKRGDFTVNETRYASRIIETLAQYPDERGDMVLDLLQRKFPAKGKRLMHWLEPEIVRLAGRMRLQAAMPILVEHLHSDEDSLIDAAVTALMKIGTDAVVEAIADDWPDASEDFRGSAADVLEKIHSDLCVENCIEFLEFEDDLETALVLAHALLSHFAFEGIEPVQEFFMIEEEEWSAEHFDLLYHLVASATIMEIGFPEYERWYQEAQDSHWGWTDYQRPRLADAFRPDPIGPTVSGNGKG